MAIDRERKYREMANRGKYQRLYTHLCGLTTDEWRTSFGEIESVIGFPLPTSARLHRPWWSNQTGGNGHSQALAWSAAGCGGWPGRPAWAREASTSPCGPEPAPSSTLCYGCCGPWASASRSTL